MKDRANRGRKIGMLGEGEEGGGNANVFDAKTDELVARLQEAAVILQ